MAGFTEWFQVAYETIAEDKTIDAVVGFKVVYGNTASADVSLTAPNSRGGGIRILKVHASNTLNVILNGVTHALTDIGHCLDIYSVNGTWKTQNPIISVE